MEKILIYLLARIKKARSYGASNLEIALYSSKEIWVELERLDNNRTH